MVTKDGENYLNDLINDHSIVIHICEEVYESQFREILKVKKMPTYGDFIKNLREAQVLLNLFHCEHPYKIFDKTKPDKSKLFTSIKDVCAKYIALKKEDETSRKNVEKLSEKSSTVKKTETGKQDEGQISVNDFVNCTKCTFKNSTKNLTCEVCLQDLQTNIHTDKNKFQNKCSMLEKQAVSDVDVNELEDKWLCWSCNKMNDYDTYSCISCKCVAPFSGKWRCECCTFINNKLMGNCEVCFFINANLINCPCCNTNKINKICEEICDKCRDKKIEAKEKNLCWKCSKNPVTNRIENCCEPCNAKKTFENHKIKQLFKWCINCKVNKTAPSSDFCDSCTSSQKKKNECKKCHKTPVTKRDPYCVNCKWECKNSHCGALNTPIKEYCDKCGLKKDQVVKQGNDVIVKIDNPKERKMWQCWYCKKFVSGKGKCDGCKSNRPVPSNKICFSCNWVNTSTYKNCEKCNKDLPKS